MTDYPYPDTNLIIFAKAPVPGLCKTRLIPELGEQGAADLQAELIGRCVEQLCTRPVCDTQLWCTPDTAHEYFQTLAKQYPLGLYNQQGQNLGERMYQALSHSQAAYKIIVGTDIPPLTRDYVEQAIKWLHGQTDAVIGPAEDGGYVLMGLKRVEKAVFQNIDWGTKRVFQQTCTKLTASGLAWQALDSLWDLDDSRDLARYKAL